MIYDDSDEEYVPMNDVPILDTMSDEQSVVYQHIKNGDNVIVDACAGSGKSTCILSIAKEMPDVKFLQLTYNAMLRREIVSKITKLKLTNLEVHTFHSLSVKFFLDTAFTDTGIRKILSEKMKPRKGIPQFHVLVLDEAQDMTLLYFQFIVYFSKLMGHPIQILVLGDYMQGLYEFKGSDIRFLTNAPDIWKQYPLLANSIFHECTLQMSYRITQPMADFVNNVMLGETRLLACREGVPVVYLRRVKHQTITYVCSKIISLIRSGDAAPSDFFILANSVNGIKSKIRNIENSLVENNIPCHVPIFENDKGDERVTEGKVVFSTFHSSKGRQRPYVFVVGFDNSYFMFSGRDLPRDTCPNTLYVACTRASKGLTVIEDDSWNTDRPLEFLKMNHYMMKSQPYIDFNGLPQLLFYKKKDEDVEPVTTHSTTPTELIKFIQESFLEEITPILDRIFVQVTQPMEEIEIPSVIKTRSGYHEEISDLNGIAIPMIFFDTHNISGNDGANTLLSLMHMNILEMKDNHHTFLRKAVSELPQHINTPSEYLLLANTHAAIEECLYSKINQIHNDEYIWLDGKMIDKSMERMNNIIGEECYGVNRAEPFIETYIIKQSENDKHKHTDSVLAMYFPTGELFRFTARTDLITDDSVWELKCTSQISIDNLLQVVIYAWLWRHCMEDIENLKNIREFKLFNIKTGEILRLESSTEDLTIIMVALLRSKYGKKIAKTKDMFINDCHNIIFQ
jgi:hypothetical protein